MHDAIAWARTSNFVATTLDGGTVILHLESGRYYSFDATGSAIWEMLESPQSQNGIVDGLMRTFDVSQQVCANSVAKFLGELRGKGLIEQE